jgi:cell shape-determining protein MreC
LVDKLTLQLNVKHYKEVYADNDLMKRELKSMAIMVEENKDLKEDLERLQKMSYDDRVKEVGEENAKLRKRNG